MSGQENDIHTVDLDRSKFSRIIWFMLGFTVMSEDRNVVSAL